MLFEWLFILFVFIVGGLWLLILWLIIWLIIKIYIKPCLCSDGDSKEFDKNMSDVGGAQIESMNNARGIVKALIA